MGITAEVQSSAAASGPPCDPSGLPVGLPASAQPRETARFLLLPHAPHERGATLLAELGSRFILKPAARTAHRASFTPSGAPV